MTKILFNENFEPKTFLSNKLIQFSNTIGHIHQYPKVPPTYILKRSKGGESWELLSNKQMGLEVQKNLALLMYGEVERGS